jgi:hypothetical protein
MSPRQSLGPAKPDVYPVPKAWDIPESIRHRLGLEAGPQRSIYEEGHLLVILHHIPKPDQTDRVPAFFWRNASGEWRSTEGKGMGPVALQNFMDAWESKLEALEVSEQKSTTATEYHTLLEEAAPILRTTRGLHRALQQARELVKDDRELINFRDMAAGLERTAELLLQDAQFGLDFIAARQSEHQAVMAQKMNATAHRLNIIAALFLPVTAIASILSMDISSGLANTRPNFWLVLGAGCLLGGGLATWVSRRR